MDGSYRLEDSKTHYGDHGAIDELMRIPDWRCRRIGQDEERKIERGVQIRSSKDLRHLGRIADETHRGKQQEVNAKKNQNQRHLVDPIGDVEARRDECKQSDRRKV